MQPQSPQPTRPDPEALFNSLFRPPITKKRSQKVMLIVATFMISGSLLITLISYAARKADNYLKDPKNTPNRSINKPPARRTK